MNEGVTPAATPAEPEPDESHFGQFGGTYIPETLHAAVAQLAEQYDRAKCDETFRRELDQLLRHYVGRPTPLEHAGRLTERLGGAQIYLKREDLAHTGAHKINNALGQALLTYRMGKHRIIAETGAGQHGVATATAAAKFGLVCDIYMGTEDMRRQRPNVLRMQLLGANVVPVESGAKTLKDATNAAMRDWMGSSDTTHYVIGSVVGPHPFPTLVRDFQSIIGTETRSQCLERLGHLPQSVIACVGGGSNAAGMFHPFAHDREVELIGAEAGGRSTSLGDHAAPLSFGEPGILHGSMSYVLQDEDGQTMPVHSVSAGLDYPGVGPEHAHWHATGRVRYTTASDEQALKAFVQLTEAEGILPALETAHALACTEELAKAKAQDEVVVVNLSGRGDKDLDEVVRLLGMDQEA